MCLKNCGYGYRGYRGYCVPSLHTRYCGVPRGCICLRGAYQDGHIVCTSERSGSSVRGACEERTVGDDISHRTCCSPQAAELCCAVRHECPCTADLAAFRPWDWSAAWLAWAGITSSPLDTGASGLPSVRTHRYRRNPLADAILHTPPRASKRP
jgi:hypothetical protein